MSYIFKEYFDGSDIPKQPKVKTYKGKKRKCGACGNIDHMLSCNKCGGFTSTYVNHFR